MTWQHTIVTASHYVGLTLPGMIELPGSFSGRESSPRPLLGPEPKNLISLAIFIKEAAIVLNEPLSYTRASLHASDSNLFGAVVNLWPVSTESCSATASAKPK